MAVNPVRIPKVPPVMWRISKGRCMVLLLQSG